MQTAEELNALKEKLEEENRRIRESDEVLKEGKGVFELEKPIKAGGKDMQTAEELKNLEERLKEENRRIRESDEVLKEGKGVFELEKPIKAGGKDITKLYYDFTDLTGIEYTDAMDGDSRAHYAHRITYRQALNLFAIAAAKKTEEVDKVDIITQMGMTDASTAVQMATIFFLASMRAARMRITRE